MWGSEGRCRVMRGDVGCCREIRELQGDVEHCERALHTCVVCVYVCGDPVTGQRCGVSVDGVRAWGLCHRTALWVWRGQQARWRPHGGDNDT